MVTNNKLNPPVLLPKQIRNMARERKDQTAVVEIAADGSERYSHGVSYMKPWRKSRLKWIKAE